MVIPTSRLRVIQTTQHASLSNPPIANVHGRTTLHQNLERRSNINTIIQRKYYFRKATVPHDIFGSFNKRLDICNEISLKNCGEMNLIHSLFSHLRYSFCSL